MDNIIADLKKIAKSKKIKFVENYFLSSDKKTVMGEVDFKEIKD